MEREKIPDINTFETQINNILIDIVNDYQPLFKEKEIEIKYNGIARFGSIDKNNYTSEVEVLFMKMDEVDYVNIFDCLIILKNKLNITLFDFKAKVKKEFAEILKNPNKDVV